MVKINSMSDLIRYLNKIPTEALKDIEKRITDWLAAGGRMDDEYIKQQFRYAEKIVNLNFWEGSK